MQGINREQLHSAIAMNECMNESGNACVQCDVISARWAALGKTYCQTCEEQTEFLSDDTRQDR